MWFRVQIPAGSSPAATRELAFRQWTGMIARMRTLAWLFGRGDRVGFVVAQADQRQPLLKGMVPANRLRQATADNFLALGGQLEESPTLRE